MGVLPTKLHERNVIKKDWRKVGLRVALCYPNLYRAGMTSLAVQLLYYLFNSRDDVVCERVFYVPGEIPRSLESGQRLSKFDVLAFSLQFENDFIHLVDMLLQSGIPPLSSDRRRPWVIAGGPCAVSNPFPLLPFIDVFFLGDLESQVDHLVEVLMDGATKENLDRQFNEHFFLKGRDAAQRSVILNLDSVPYPICQVLPVPPYPSQLEPAFGQSYLLEISRGCDRRCNFCLTSYQCGPRRERSVERLLSLVDEGTKCTGVNKVALLSSALVDYSRLSPLLEAIVNRNLAISVPSLRVDHANLSLFELIFRGGQRTLTFAPEAGTERLRQVIAKSTSDDALQQVIHTAIIAGFNQFKLYFLIGLPTETDDDILAIQTLCQNLLDISPRRHRLHVSIGIFIPKAHTPFQWLGLTSPTILKNRLAQLRKLRQGRRLVIDFPNIRESIIQAVLSRGTTALAPLLLKVAQEQSLKMSAWFKVARELKLDLETLATQSFSPSQVLPWELFDVQLNRNILLQRYASLEE